MQIASFLAALPAVLGVSCNNLKESPMEPSAPAAQVQVSEVSPEGIARLMASLPLDKDSAREVWDAVSSSSDNGYDEEYTFRSLVSTPGAGVGDGIAGTKAREYPGALAGVLESYASARAMTRSGEDFMAALRESGLQIYWPYSEDWDGESMPVLTFDPENGSEKNIGFERVLLEDGTWKIKEITVDETVAKTRPVWVINRNRDEGFMTPRLMEKINGNNSSNRGTTRASSSVKTLKLKQFKAHRNYDSWLAGASEFFVKCGSVENFTARTEDELKEYSPAITDFMIVVKRKQVGTFLTLNVVLVSEWTEQLQNCAFFIIEDDGGKQTTWKTNAEVKIKSKTYGFNIELPYNRNDDIVWRGSLSRSFLENYSGTANRYGDVSITFDIVSR